MSGYTGTSVNAVFKVMIISICINLCIHPWSYAAVFYSHDVFSQSISKDDAELLNQPRLKEISNEHRILVFIDPQCPWCKKSLENLSGFKKRNPYWSVQVYVMAPLNEFIEFFRKQISNLPPGLDYTLDFKNAVADTYGIGRTPTYIIINHGRIKKVEGYVDLAHFVVDDHA